MIYLEIYFVILALLLVICVKVDMAIKKYKSVDNKKNLSGMEIARNLLDDNKLESVYVIEKRSKFIDRYVYNRKTVILSSDVFHENSLYALAVGAYVGMHGVYDKKNNSLFRFIETFGVVRYASYFASLVLLLLGMFNDNVSAYQIALILLIFSLIFSVLAFVVNRNAAYDTYDYLKKNKCFEKSEDDDISTILKNVYLESFTWYFVVLVNGIINTINESKKN